MIITNTAHVHQILVALSVDPLVGAYIFDGANLSVPGKTEQQIAYADTSLDAVAKKDALSLKVVADYRVRNQPKLEQIAALEQSIDTARIRREYAEGMRKKLTGLSPTADELWSIAKVQDVADRIIALQIKLK